MLTKTGSKAYRRLLSAMEFSMEPNTYLWQEVRRVADISRPVADRLLSLFHTFGVLTAVWAFESFLTERCMEKDEADGRRKRSEHWRKRKWWEKLQHLRPDSLTPDAWQRRLCHYTPVIYFRARNLWCHGVGMADAVKPENQPDATDVSAVPDNLDPQSADPNQADEANYYRDREGRLWAKRKLWVGCSPALKALAKECW